MLRPIFWWLPIVFMVAITPFTSVLDLAITRAIYQNTRFASNDFFDFMYTYGVLPAQVTALVAGVIFILSYCSAYWKKWRPGAKVLLLTIAIGAGFITHTLLKDHWGRPRPKQVEEFGGHQPFRPFYEPNFFHQPEPSKSFPCGHCTMGFYFFALALVARRMNYRALEVIGIALAIVLGVALSITRIAQGGHFFSDTLMSALIMWMTAATSDWLVFSEDTKAFPIRE